MSLLSIKVVLFFGALALAALFSFLETAFTALRLFKLKEIKAQKKRYLKLFDIWEKAPRRILITILIANSFANVLCSVLITDITQSWLGDTGIALAIGALTATILILVLGEIIPKSYAKERYEHFLGSTLWIFWGIFYFLTPIVSILIWISDLFIKQDSANESSDTVTEQEIEFLIDYSDEKKIMESEKTEMLQNVFTLGQTLAKEIMVPATDMVMVESKASLEDVMAVFLKSRFTRLPVYQDREDNIIGIVHQKDLFDILYHQKKKNLSEILIPTVFVPETKKINSLLSELLRERIHMAILIDEHGAVMGLVTLEDIIEEIVGEISDEHETVHKSIIPLDEESWLVEARIDLEDLEEFLNISLDVEESVTLGGFMAERLQRLPVKGDRVYHQGYCFEVKQASARRVYQILIFKDNKSEQDK